MSQIGTWGTHLLRWVDVAKSRVSVPAGLIAASPRTLFSRKMGGRVAAVVDESPTYRPCPDTGPVGLGWWYPTLATKTRTWRGWGTRRCFEVEIEEPEGSCSLRFAKGTNAGPSASSAAADFAQDDRASLVVVSHVPKSGHGAPVSCGGWRRRKTNAGPHSTRSPRANSLRAGFRLRPPRRSGWAWGTS